MNNVAVGGKAGFVKNTVRHASQGVQAGQPAPAVTAWPKDRMAGQGGVPAGLLAAERARPQPTRKRQAGAADAAWVVQRLEEAGATLLSLPPSGWTTRLRTARLDIVRSVAEIGAGDVGRLRLPMPDAARVDRMDEALGWVSYIPLERHMLRRIVGARALVNPMTERHLFSWRRLGGLLGADHKAVQRWHAEGIGLIMSGLAG